MARIEEPPPLFNRQVRLFFEPFQLHLEASDLLEQLRLLGLGLGGGVRLDAAGEDLFSGGEQVLLPILDEGRMHAERGGQFVDSLVSFECGERHLSLERRRILLSLGCHHYPFPGPPD
jgi:hypothetical protein